MLEDPRQVLLGAAEHGAGEKRCGVEKDAEIGPLAEQVQSPLHIRKDVARVGPQAEFDAAGAEGFGPNGA